MFGVGTIRTRTDYSEAVLNGLPSCPSSGSGTESALLRTRSLLEGATQQHKHVLSNGSLPADVRVDELEALSLLRLLLGQLETCILENENPPPTISKRKTLIKVEKARRGVLAAVRECCSRVMESQKLFEEVERFIELRPEEPVSPRNFNIKWTCKVPLRHTPRRRELGPGRHPRLGESLVMSIAGLSAIAEGRERDTRTSDAGATAGGETLPTPKASASLLPVPPRRTTPYAATPAGRAVDAACQRYPREESSGRAAAAAAAAGGSGSSALSSTEQSIQDAALLLMQLQQLQPRRVINSVDGEDDLRPSLSHDVQPTSGTTTTTTMCNIDSCVSGVPLGPAHRGASSAAVGTGGEGTDSNLCSYGARVEGNDDGGDSDEDEVNSAERSGCETGSPNHRVSLLTCARAVTATAADDVVAPTASPPVSTQLQDQSHVAQGSEGLQRQKLPVQGMTAAKVNSLPVSGEPRRRTHIPATASQLPLLPPLCPATTSSLYHDGRAAGSDEFFLNESSQAAAAELDTIGLEAARNPAPLLPTQRPPPPQSRFGSSGRQHAAGGTGAVPATADAAMHHPHFSQHPAHAAALAAAAAHPYGPNGFPHPNIHHHTHTHAYLHTATLVDAAAAPSALGPHSVPPSLPSSLRDFPVATGAAGMRSGSGRSDTGSGGGALANVEAVIGTSRVGTSLLQSGHHSLDSGRFPASATGWDNVSLAETDPVAGTQGRRGGRRRGGKSNGLLAVVRHVVGFVGVSVLSGAAMALGAAAMNTGLDDQEAAQNGRQRQKDNSSRRNQQQLGRGDDDLIPKRTLQHLRSPDLLALGRG